MFIFIPIVCIFISGCSDESKTAPAETIAQAPADMTASEFGFRVAGRLLQMPVPYLRKFENLASAVPEIPTGLVAQVEQVLSKIEKDLNYVNTGQLFVLSRDLSLIESKHSSEFAAAFKAINLSLVFPSDPNMMLFLNGLVANALRHFLPEYDWEGELKYFWTPSPVNEDIASVRNSFKAIWSSKNVDAETAAPAFLCSFVAQYTYESPAASAEDKALAKAFITAMEKNHLSDFMTEFLDSLDAIMDKSIPRKVQKHII